MLCLCNRHATCIICQLVVVSDGGEVAQDVNINPTGQAGVRTPTEHFLLASLAFCCGTDAHALFGLIPQTPTNSAADFQ